LQPYVVKAIAYAGGILIARAMVNIQFHGRLPTNQPPLFLM
jgi:hypothetical protein